MSMQIYTFEVLGMEVSFKAEADPRRLEKARNLLCERYDRLGGNSGKGLTKEKLLTYLALALADDYLQAKEELDAFNRGAQTLLEMLEPVTRPAHEGPAEAENQA